MAVDLQIDRSVYHLKKHRRKKNVGGAFWLIIVFNIENVFTK